MAGHHLTAEDLRGKVIDCHSHVGISLKAYACQEYPYAQSLEGLYYQQLSAGVDVNIVFPLCGDLYFDPTGLAEGIMRPAERPLSPLPYQAENAMLMREVFEFCPEIEHRFIPFLCVDPAREARKQLASIIELARRFPIYGIKISGVQCQSAVTSLLHEGSMFMDYARDRNIPFLLHTTVDPLETYSHASLCFSVIEAHPEIRFCLAHCIGFHREYLRAADALPNVWVDTAALTIQVQLARENNPVMAAADQRFPADYSDHRKVLLALTEAYPNTILWGSDSPFYTFICRRRQGEHSTIDFRLKARYSDERAALDALPAGLRMKASSTNTLRFLFGDSQPAPGEHNDNL